MEILNTVKRKLLYWKNAKQTLEKKINFYSQFISPNDVCFDVGANMGNRTEPFLKLNAKVVAVEPQKHCQAFLKQKFGDKISLVAKGLGEKEGEKTFYISDDSVLSSFSEEWINSVIESKRFGTHKWHKTELIEMTTLDILIKQYGIPQFIKIDVEGYELEVLKGLSQPVNVISFEYAVPEHTQKVIDCIKQIEKVNGDTLFNHSVGESMELFFSEWLTFERMIEYVKSREFENFVFGDIYAQRKQIDCSTWK
jgi:FkbM family methyltransferase